MHEPIPRGGRGGGDVPTGGDDGGEEVGEGGADDGGEADSGTEAAGEGEGEGEAPCALVTWDCPYLIEALPYSVEGDTRQAASDEVDSYACAPDISEAGGEVIYAVDILEPGILTAGVDDVGGDGVDVDVHLLTGPLSDDCVARDNTQVARRVEPGRWFIALDTWTNAQGQEFPGPYELTVELRPLPGGGDCAMVEQRMEMFWRDCPPAGDGLAYECTDHGDARYLTLPATGPVVKEAHLVTRAEADDFAGSGGWPTAFTDGIERHYELSETVSEYVMDRREPWAPAGEGGSEFGQGSTGGPVPVLDEAWYITMYWRQRPPGGTRMIVLNPANGKAVVASAGWETGPGANTAVAGVTEEIHHHLGTTHRSPLTVGFAALPDLPLGPITCD